jgi:hypothetical protein
MGEIELTPGPYWPETGQAHITCKAELLLALEAFVAMAVAFRLMREAAFISEIEECAGMTSCPPVYSGRRRRLGWGKEIEIYVYVYVTEGEWDAQYYFWSVVAI